MVAEIQKLPAYFDGEKIQVETPFVFKRNARLIVVVLPEPQPAAGEWWRPMMDSLDLFGDDFKSFMDSYLETRKTMPAEDRGVMFP